MSTETMGTIGARGALTCAFVIASLISVFAGPKFTFEKDHWYGESYEDSDNNFSHCVMSLHNDENQIFMLKLSKIYELSAAVSDTKWEYEYGHIGKMRIIFDHELVYDGPTLAISKDVLYVDLENFKAKFETMRSSQEALFQINGESVFFKLGVIREAVRALGECVALGRAEPTNI